MAQVETLKNKRTALKMRITKCNNWIQAKGRDAMVELIEEKLKTIREKFAEWEQSNDTLLELDLDHATVNLEETETIEDAYHNAVASLKHLMNTKNQLPSSAPISQQTPTLGASYPPQFNMKLPELTLDKFDGSFDKYRPFRDQFNARLPSSVGKVIRLQYLQSLVIGEAQQVIEALEITEHNYEVAWDLLDKKYNVPRQALRRHCTLLLNVGKRNRESNKSLTDLVNFVRQQLRLINAFGSPEEQLNGLISTIILNQLDDDLVFQWETHIEGNDMPKYELLLDFLEKRGICAKSSTESSRNNKQKSDPLNRNPAQKGSTFKHQGNPSFSHSNPKAQTFFSNIIKKCPVCTEEHRIYECPKFMEMDIEKRKKVIFNQGRCLNCFAKGHGVKECKSKYFCKTCNDPEAKHHSLLHYIKESPPTPSTTRQDILPTAIINILNKNRQPVPCRALIDTGSTRNFITQELAAELGITKITCSIPIGALDQLSTIVSHKINTTITSRLNKFKKELSFLIIPRISSLIPNEQIDRDLLDIPKNLPLADLNFHKPAPIQVLLGSSTSISVLSIGQIKLPNAADVHLQKTLFGWIVCGSMSDESDHDQAKCHFTKIIDEFKRFWEIEDIGLRESHQSEEEAACQLHFKQHVSRNSEGRYVVALPFNEKKAQLGTSLFQAKRRLLSLERKFQWNPKLAEEYTKVINEYIDLGHMKKVNAELEDGFYLPHHAVIKETSLTTKTRVVFDGSARSSTGLSLNDALMVGPTIQDDILSLVLRFRLHNYILTGDIEKMYRQVLVRPEDRKYQRILWREKDKINTYELQTVTFGLSSAPFLAVRCLHQLANDEYERYPVAAERLKRDLYVDDLLTGTATLEEALHLRDDIMNLLKEGGFNLRQCASNTPDILQGLPKSTVNLQLLGGDDPTLKTLGIHWDSQNDSIVYTVNPIATRDVITMRTIASDVARIFDPLGLLNPVVTYAKIIQQELWRLKLNWDDSTPTEIHTKWNEFASQLPLLNKMQFKRQVTSNLKHVEVHGFCDASQSNHTIPRLELCAMELLSNLYATVKKATDLTPHREVFWSDSTVALHWIRTSPHLLQRFVANRVSRIQDLTKNIEWRHVRTYDNPADAVSRGELASDFLKNHLWLHGPSWLHDPEEYWPHLLIEKPSELPELRKVTCLHVTEHASNLFLRRYSSFERLKRITGWCLRWRKRSSHKYLTLSELKAAETKLLQLVQEEVFSTELSLIRQGKPLSSKNRLKNLSLKLDDNGLIRVGGRLRKARNFPLDSKHPILLPKGHYITHLLIKKAHLANLHPGIQTTLHLLRQRYWPINGRSQVRFIIHKCVNCAKVDPPSINYPMADLPSIRITQANPFTHTGVDYCGPFLIKERRYLHIELVDDLTSEEFLATLSRFISRHPSCKALYSDNATTFIGANKELKELYALLNDEKHGEFINRKLNEQGIEWNFIPPASPHCGGIWEAAVKSCKQHMKRVIGNELLTYQQFNTLCIKIEGILNSRPLTPLSSDPNDFNALTPAHFLHGHITTDLPAPDWTEVPSNRLSYWKHLEKLKQHFWNRWHKEYLSELNIRHKWTSGHHDIGVGALVLLRDDNLPPLKWRMGRVIKIYPSDDGITRKARLRTSTGEVDRNLRRLAPLPVDSSISKE
ncbi:uncharacterized protein LOC135171055 [Diachasmimorpha longicaudata]|uniref:uncharacterized protein LOC135171055 n=1 Tax=Diachasmimorpha longicaudata TaxID=58733 RepID=UPI0030B877C2